MKNTSKLGNIVITAYVVICLLLITIKVFNISSRVSNADYNIIESYGVNDIYYLLDTRVYSEMGIDTLFTTRRQAIDFFSNLTIYDSDKAMEEMYRLEEEIMKLQAEIERIK